MEQRSEICGKMGIFCVLFLKVTGIILRGIFLLRKKELDWFYEGGAAAIFPDGMYDTNPLDFFFLWVQRP